MDQGFPSLNRGAPAPVRRHSFLRYRYRWRAGNRFRVLVDGAQFFPAMLEAIEAAREAIALNLYLFESGDCADRWIGALSRAVERGVRVYVLLDDFGCLRLSSADRERLGRVGVQLAVFNRLRLGKGFVNFLRDHRKLLWIDGERAFTGGFGVADEFDSGVVGDRCWHDMAIEIAGPCVGDWGDAFARDWLRRTGNRPVLPRRTQRDEQGYHGHLSVNAPGRFRETRRSLLRHIRRARLRVWIATAYFVPPHRLRRELTQAARRGVDVRLLLPGTITDHGYVRDIGVRVYGRLLRSGVRIFEYQPRFSHTKAVICDNWISVGSSNFDHWTLRWTLDANQEVRSWALADELASVFTQDFGDSLEVMLPAWRQRPWLERLRGRLFAWGHVVLSLLSYRRRIRLEIRRRRQDTP